MVMFAIVEVEMVLEVIELDPVKAVLPPSKVRTLVFNVSVPAPEVTVLPLTVATVKAVTLVVAKVDVDKTCNGPETVRAEVDALPKVARPLTFKVDWSTAGPEAVKLATVVLAKVEVPAVKVLSVAKPVTAKVPERFKFVKDGEATTAMVEVPLILMFDPWVNKEVISLKAGAKFKPFDVNTWKAVPAVVD
jgi:hypothetical protein